MVGAGLGGGFSLGEARGERTVTISDLLSTLPTSSHAQYLEAWRAGMRASTMPGHKLSAIRTALRRSPEGGGGALARGGDLPAEPAEKEQVTQQELW